MRKELREIRRDPLLLAIALALPVALLLIFGFAISFDIDAVPMAVADFDQSNESVRLVDAFVNTGHYVVRERAATERGVRRLLDAGRVELALVIPPGFAEDLGAGRPARVQTIIDGSFSARAVVIRNEVDAITARFGADRLAAAGRPPKHPGINAVPEAWYNPSLKSATSVVPGLIAVIVMAVPPLLAALAIVRERESGSVQQIYVSPLKSWEFIAGKMLPYVAIALGQLASLVLLGTWWFGLAIRGSWSLLILGSVVYVFCSVGIGLLVSTVARTQVVAILLALIITVMPSFLFSGFLYPISSMSPAARWQTYLIPTRDFVDISRGVFLKGTALSDHWSQFARLVAYTAIVFGIAALRFKKKVA